MINPSLNSGQGNIKEKTEQEFFWVGNYVFPASSSQKMLWFLYNLDARWIPVYNIPTALKINGKINRIVLQRSVNYIVSRHESLRTRIAYVDGELKQVVKPEAQVTLSYIDLSVLKVEERSDETLRLMALEAQSPFSLSEDSLLRITLFKLSQEEHYIQIVINHIVADGLSLEILGSELIKCYLAFLEDVEPQLNELPIQFGDFVAWQQEWMQTKDYDRHREYWLKKLSNVPFQLELPTDYLRLSNSSMKGATKQFAISKATVALVKNLAREMGTTIYVVLLSAFASVIRRYVVQQEFLIGIPIANRQRSEFESMIGYLANTLVLHCDFKGDPNVKELLARFHKTILEAMEHPRLPFANLVEELRPDRSMNRNPIFQIMFGFQEIQPLEFNSNNIKFSQCLIDYGFSKFDLSFFLLDDKNSIKGYVEYNPSLFDSERIEKFIHHYELTLEAFIHEQNQRISEIKLLSFSQGKHSYPTFSATFKEVVKPSATIAEMLEMHAIQNSNQTAMVYDNQLLTYKELNEQVNSYANSLIKKGLCSGNSVVIALNHRLERMLTMLAVLKAGAFYVILEPTIPIERARNILNEINPSFVVVKDDQQEFSNSLLQPLQKTTKVIVLESLNFEKINVDNPKINMSSDTLAFVSYEPMLSIHPIGIRVTHKDVVNQTELLARKLRLTSQDVFAAFSSQSMEMSALELFLPLYLGAKIIVLDVESELREERSLSALEQHAVTVLQATHSVWDAILKSSVISSLKLTALCYGETLPLEIYDSFLRKDINVWNLHGSLGGVVYLSQKQLMNAIENTALITHNPYYVVDQNLHPVPVGVCGELIIGGVGPSNGYYSNTKLTANQFLPDPFSNTPGERIFKTKHLVRLRNDNSIELIATKSDCVQFKGLSINLREIEDLLKSYPSVQQAAILICGNKLENTKLIAYLVTSELEKALLEQQLNEFIKRNLSEILLPVTIQFKDFLPLNVNKEIDYNALKELYHSSTSSNKEQLMPRTPIENKMMEIWQRLLNNTNIGVRDDFFQAGGNSILVGQLAVEIEKEFNLKISMKNIFQSATIENLSFIIESKSTESDDGPIEDTLNKMVDQLTDSEVDLLLKNANVQLAEEF